MKSHNLRSLRSLREISLRCNLRTLCLGRRHRVQPCRILVIHSVAASMIGKNCPRLAASTHDTERPKKLKSHLSPLDCQFFSATSELCRNGLGTVQEPDARHCHVPAAYLVVVSIAAIVLGEQLASKIKSGFDLEGGSAMPPYPRLAGGVNQGLSTY